MCRIATTQATATTSKNAQEKTVAGSASPKAAAETTKDVIVAATERRATRKESPRKKNGPTPMSGRAMSVSNCPCAAIGEL